MAADPHAPTPDVLLGEEVTDRQVKVPLDVWARALDASTRQPTGTLRRVRMRTLGEIASDLERHLDVIVCDKCGDEKPRRPGIYTPKHKRCGGEYEWLIDEYFHGPDEKEARAPAPHDLHRICCYAVTGGSEGHYVHVELRSYLEHRQPADATCNARIVRLALIKTFKGMGYAAMLALRCAKLLGA